LIWVRNTVDKITSKCTNPITPKLLQLDATSASTEENNGKLLALEKQVDDLKTELNQSQ
jgi:hypothetical protein